MYIKNIEKEACKITVTFLGGNTDLGPEICVQYIDLKTPLLVKNALIHKLSKVIAINIIHNDNDTTTFRFGCYGLNLIMNNDKKTIQEFKDILRTMTGIDTYNIRPYEIKDEVFYAIDYTIETPTDLDKINQYIYDDLNRYMKIIITNY